MTDWTAAYRRLYKFLDGYTGSQFIKTVQQVDPDLLDYMDYIEKRRKEDKSRTKKDYFKDILLFYPDDIKHHLFEIFLSSIDQTNPDDAKDIRKIINGGKVEIAKAIYAKAVASKEIDETLIGDTLKGLEIFPEAYKLYKKALSDFNSGNDERHILDDLRLSVEYFLRSILRNEKTLENQIPYLGKYQKDKGISSEISNTFQKLIEIFGKYQNNYVKHHDKVKHSEIEFILNLTNTFYRFLLSH
jgi:hypothetical protein